MTYRIARNGQVFGPYTLEQVQQYMASRNIVAGDLAQADGSGEWLPVSQVFPLASVAEAPGFAGAAPGFAWAAPAYAGVPALYPDPPNLPWWVAAIAEVFSDFLFFDGFNIYTSAWLRRIDKSSIALYFYIAQAVLVVIDLPNTYHATAHWIWGAPVVSAHHGASLGILTWMVRLIARFVFRGELLRHFNTAEPIGLRLNGFLTFLFGGLYFQYKFNEINRVKRMLQVSVPAM